MASSSNTGAGNAAGFINPRHLTSRVQKMSWTVANDVKLLLHGMERECTPKEHAAIAATFPEGPTPKAISERLAKLRGEQRALLVKIGILPASAGPAPKKKKRPAEESGAEESAVEETGGQWVSPFPFRGSAGAAADGAKKRRRSSI